MFTALASLILVGSMASAPCENPGITFGKSASHYVAGRKGYPDEVFQAFSAYVSKEGRILELGCGTGIATRQLYDKGFTSIVATDIDPLMIKEAEELCPEVRFQREDAQALSFSDHTFDAVVAFGCFHWFCNQDALEEIKRVLKPGGHLLIVNKKDRDSFRQEFRHCIEQLRQKPVQEPKSKYRPIDTLTENHFSARPYRWTSTEIFTRQELLHYCQSLSPWTSLTPDEQQRYLPCLQQFVDHKLNKERYEMRFEVQCLVGELD